MRQALTITIALTLLSLSGCMVGPNYKTPAAITAPAFKEATPASFTEQDGWKPGQPGDTKLKGDWWTLFQDTRLNELEDKVDTANQSLKLAEANFRSARAQMRHLPSALRRHSPQFAILRISRTSPTPS